MYRIRNLSLPIVAALALLTGGCLDSRTPTVTSPDARTGTPPTDLMPADGEADAGGGGASDAAADVDPAEVDGAGGGAGDASADAEMEVDDADVTPDGEADAVEPGDADGTDDAEVAQPDAADGPDGDAGLLEDAGGDVGAGDDVTEVSGGEEACNGEDDDGDGDTDEGFGPLGTPCDGDDADACENGVLSCTSDGTSSRCVEPGEPATESCNGSDDDCDGDTDEGLEGCAGTCDDGLDQDDDGLTDCEEEGCAELEVCVCGDDVCDATEGCEGCPEDCGPCVVCGDGSCDGGENCQSCPDDCGPCSPECGDGSCNADENCSTCPGDCGSCSGDCCSGNDSPGCESTSCTESVCEVAPICCSLVWDDDCADCAAGDPALPSLCPGADEGCDCGPE